MAKDLLSERSTDVREPPGILQEVRWCEKKEGENGRRGDGEKKGVSVSARAWKQNGQKLQPDCFWIFVKSLE